MMAITIRDTSEHNEMLAELKELTGCSTISKALIKGGYDAIRYHRWYLQSEKENQNLKEQLYNRDQAIGDFIDSFENLRNVVKD